MDAFVFLFVIWTISRGVLSFSHEEATCSKDWGCKLTLEQLTDSVAVLLPDDPGNYEDSGVSDYLEYLFLGSSGKHEYLPAEQYQELIKNLAVLSVNPKFKDQINLALGMLTGEYEEPWNDVEIELYGANSYGWDNTHPGEPFPQLKPRYQLIAQYLKQS